MSRDFRTFFLVVENNLFVPLSEQAKWFLKTAVFAKILDCEVYYSFFSFGNAYINVILCLTHPSTLFPPIVPFKSVTVTAQK